MTHIENSDIMLSDETKHRKGVINMNHLQYTTKTEFVTYQLHHKSHKVSIL